MDRHDVLPAVLAWITFPFAGVIILTLISKACGIRQHLHKKVNQ